MERKKCILIYFSLVFLISLIYNDNYDEIIYNAYRNNNMNEWKRLIDRLQSLTIQDNKILIQLINYQYGYVAWCLGNNKKKEAEHYLKLAYKNLKILLDKNYDLSTLYAYKSAFIGFEIALNVYRAPIIGKKSLEYIEKSIKLNPENYFSYFQKGNIYNYTPEIFGGSKKIAIENYKKALELYEKYEKNLKNWNYLNLYASIIMTYIEIKDYIKARYYCEKILEKEQNFLWIKNDLYPKTQNK